MCEKDKTYRAIRHDVVRKKQRENSPEVHHPDEKIRQVQEFLEGKSDLKILELFAGGGNLTKIYQDYIGDGETFIGQIDKKRIKRNKGALEVYDKDNLKTGDSYSHFHRLIAEKRVYDVIDIDPYGFPLKMLPDVFLLMLDGYMFMTFPKPWVNIPNGITKKTLENYMGVEMPTLEQVKERIKTYALCHWRGVEYVDTVDLGRLWRFTMRVKRIKATEYCGVRNRPY